ncbi:hypothetical protein PROFUN_01919 [Planoprotostelium fungivorum]|uniref:Nucleotide exchange factor Fes1 domain-containing protein n=1 Tax=Planoprotostelium fungivorum TaxID=1890364 RepID=A0A2P6NZ36_9EUKA|nr:hypothetical protein PROFUN_01919 [Planoprotostelium fungivorum]
MASLHELFQWSIQHQAAANQGSNESAPPAQRREISASDREFLNAAIRTDASKMKGLVDMYVSPTSTVEAKEVALEELEFYVQTIDNASDISHGTVDGLNPLLKGIQYDDRPNFRTPSVRTGCAWVLSTAAQNNPNLQEAISKAGGEKAVTDALKDETNQLFKLMDSQEGFSDTELTERGDLNLISKLIAVASALFENPSFIESFRENGGFTCLFQLLKLDVSKLDPLQHAREQAHKRIISGEENIDEDRRILERVDALEAVDSQQTGKVFLDVEDQVALRARELQKSRARARLAPGTTDYNDTKESDRILWLRLARRVTHVLYKLLFILPEAYTKGKEGVAIECLVHLLEKHKDNDLREKTVKILEVLLEREDQRKQVKALGLNERLVKSLRSMEEDNRENEDVSSQIREVIKRVS